MEPVLEPLLHFLRRNNKEEVEEEKGKERKKKSAHPLIISRSATVEHNMTS